jgi:ribokinase
MRILNFGSMNIDHVYSVDHFVRPGETMGSLGYKRFVGGKGCNQSIALAHAGASVFHFGKIGAEGVFLKDRLIKAGVDTSLITISDSEASGHAIIQVNPSGENCIVLYGGTNQTFTEDKIDVAIAQCTKGDFVLLQNETNAAESIMKKAHTAGLRIVLNPAPMTNAVLSYPLDLISIFIVNELEGGDLTRETEPDAILNALVKKFPKAEVVLTLGSAGVKYAHGATRISMPCITVTPVDTTAAGDTFIGFFLAALAAGIPVETALKSGNAAAALCVTRPGAADSIPTKNEVIV